MMGLLKWVGFVAGFALFLLTVMSIIKTLIVPRGLASRFSAIVEKAIRKAFLIVANRFEDYGTKDRILVLVGPLSILGLLLVWMLLLLLAFALMLWPFADAGFGSALRESGSSLLTLGFAGTDEVAPTILHFLAAGTGLIVVALQISYLPTLYNSFNRRETLVTMLQSRAGSPAWGPEILMRHQAVGLMDNLPHFYGEWENWAADVAESHTNYPVLIYFRSPHPLRSWVVGLLAVLDSAALQLSLNPSTAPTEARLCIRMGFLCLRGIAVANKIPHDPDPFPDDPIELTFEDFRGAIHKLEAANFPMERTPEEAWPHFRGWRVNYESVAYAIGDRIVAPPGPWSGARTHLPGVEIVPIRPANRQPGQASEDAPPKGQQGL